MIDALAIKLLGSVLNDLYKLGGSFFKRKKNSKTISKAIEIVHNHILNLKEVKTLWSMDSSVDLNSFYIPPRISYQEVTEKYNNISNFSSRNCLIVGPAGQGKSIFLRYLCIRELSVGEYIPVFVELRKIKSTNATKDGLLRQAMVMGLDAMELPTDDNSLEEIMNSQKFVFMMDGFDELIEHDQDGILSEMEHYCQKYLKIRIFVTSRPDTCITKSPFFNVYKMSPLGNPEIAGIVNKLSVDIEQEKGLILAIKNKSINALITTPLVVVILVIVYKSYSDLPETLPEFYEELFIVLLRRHDKTKGGFNRPRLSGLDDMNFQYVFSAFSFLTSKEKRIEMDEEEIISFVGKALKKELFDAVLPSAYIDDLTRITNLVLRDGRYYKFIHRTIQEYFAAKYVARALDSDAENFYSIIRRNKSLIESWRQPLIFLKEIDSYRYNKYYYLPIILSTGLFTLSSLENNCLPLDFLNSLNVSLEVYRRIGDTELSGELFNRKIRVSFREGIKYFV